MNRSTLTKLGAVGAATLTVGAGAGILGTAGAQDRGAPAPRSDHGYRGHHGFRAHHGHRLARAVHLEAVVAVRGGGFATVTADRGFLTARDGARLTLRQGTRKATWRTQTFVVPAGAKVRRDRAPATLADLRVGDVVRIVHGPHHTRVVAHVPRSR